MSYDSVIKVLHGKNKEQRAPRKIHLLYEEIHPQGDQEAGEKVTPTRG